MMKFSTLHKRMMKDPGYRKEYDALEEEFALIAAVALAKRDSVRVDGRLRPLSSRATVLCVVFMRLASSACRQRARCRASPRRPDIG